MKFYNVKNIMWALLAVLVLASCSKEQFTVNGHIQNAKDSLLYLEHMSLEGPVVVDSVRLQADGSFEFKADAKLSCDSVKTPKYYPEFYRLRIHDQIINVSADSTEVVTVKAKYPEMSWKYEISASNGSKNCQKIHDLTMLQIELQNQIILISRTQGITNKEMADSIDGLVDRYKQRIKTDYIAQEPMKPYAYFALFQTVGGQLIFNPQGNVDDMKMYRAVATSWDTFYPGSERGRNLYNIAIEGRKTQLILEKQRNDLIVDASKVQVTNMIELKLTDNSGREVPLSSMKGHLTLLDFHAFGQDGSMEYIMRLRSIYEKYHSRGLEIYQIGLDGNEHFWKTSVKALPWVNVYDPNGSSMTSYNVTVLPMGYLLGSDCSAILRYETLDGLEAEIEKNL